MPQCEQKPSEIQFCLYTILTPSAFNVDFEQVFSYKALLPTYNTYIPETYLEPSRQSTIDLFLQK